MKLIKRVFSKFNERCVDVAKYPCTSCNKLCFKRECSQVNRLRSVPCNRNWEILFEFIESRPDFDDSLLTGYICHYCLEYFRSDKLPPWCILNGLDFGVVPEEIKVLNPYERVLIQRAKCFQTVTRMGTVAKKHSQSPESLWYHISSITSFARNIEKVARTTSTFGRYWWVIHFIVQYPK